MWMPPRRKRQLGVNVRLIETTSSPNRHIYIRHHLCLIMAKNKAPARKPDLRTTTDARIPTNTGPVLGDCYECDGPCHEYINLAGTDGGNTLICLPCYANHLDWELIPYDDLEQIELPLSPETIEKYSIIPNGVNQTLDCGCILTDMNDGGKKYITLCDTHRIFLDAKILMVELDYQSCTDCDKLFPEHELTLCRARKNMETICLCPGCFIESPYYYSEWGA